MPTDITGRNTRTGDVREGFANLIYTTLNGIQAHARALKIYNSDGAEEYSDAEVQLLRSAAERLCTPLFIDALRRQIDNR